MQESWGLGRGWLDTIDSDNICYNIYHCHLWHTGNGGNAPNPRYISLVDTAWKHSKYPCVCTLPLESEVNMDIQQNMKTTEFYVQTTINLQRKCLGTPDCKYMENMIIDFIWLNVQAKYLIQIISCHFKWDMALQKWPKCPSTCCEPGGKHWQHSIWVRHNFQ